MDKSTIKQFISEQSLFSGLDEAQLDTLAEHARLRELAADEVVASQGSKAETFYQILEGALVVEVPALMGPKLEIARLKAGEVFGWSWLIAPYEWHFHARASGPTRVLEFDGKALLERCEADPAFGYPLLRRFSELMARRLDAAQRKMMDQWSPPGFA
ncbi:MAG: Crp/Fnr family transcriptional regulator [Wenzhouxiangella sp.]